MSLMSRYRLQFLVAWLAMDASVRAQLSPRQMPGVVGMLGQALSPAQQRHQPGVQRLLHGRAWPGRCVRRGCLTG